MERAHQSRPKTSTKTPKANSDANGSGPTSAIPVASLRGVSPASIPVHAPGGLVSNAPVQFMRNPFKKKPDPTTDEHTPPGPGGAGLHVDEGSRSDKITQGTDGIGAMNVLARGAQNVAGGAGKAVAESLTGATIGLDAFGVWENAQRGRDAAIMEKRMGTASALAKSGSTKKLLDHSQQWNKGEKWRRGGRTALSAAGTGLGIALLAGSGGAALPAAALAVGTVKGLDTTRNLFRKAYYKKSRTAMATQLADSARTGDPGAQQLLKSMNLNMPAEKGDKHHERAVKLLTSRMPIMSEKRLKKRHRYSEQANPTEATANS